MKKTISMKKKTKYSFVSSSTNLQIFKLLQGFTLYLSSRFTRTLFMSAAEKKVANEKCAACYRKVVAKGKKYCIYHSQAYDSLQKQYGAWVHAYAKISMGDYMKKLLTLNETGIWVKEVINAELKKESKKDLGS